VWPRLRLFVGLAVALGGLFLAGAITPRLFVGDGLADLPNETRAIGEVALREAWGACSESFNGVLNRRLRVVQVQVPGTCPTVDGGAASGYRVLIQKHTFFGIPLGKIAVCESGGVCDVRTR
jgi:hypothetical protein